MIEKPKMLDIAKAADKITLSGDRRKKPWVMTNGKIIVDEVLRGLHGFFENREEFLKTEREVYANFGLEYDEGKNL